MAAGKILSAEQNGVHVLKFLGDVRLTLSAALENFVNRMFDSPGFGGVVIDLTETENIDSTSLGLLARIAIRDKKQFGDIPTIVSTREDITRLLDSMGFARIFCIVTDSPDSTAEAGVDIESLDELSESEREAKRRVIEAHRTLMSLNAANHETFSGLVEFLENEDD